MAVGAGHVDFGHSYNIYNSLASEFQNGQVSSYRTLRIYFLSSGSSIFHSRVITNAKSIFYTKYAKNFDIQS